MAKVLGGPRIDFIEQKFGLPIEEILKPYLKYRTPIPQIANMIGVSEPTMRFWIKRLKLKKRRR